MWSHSAFDGLIDVEPVIWKYNPSALADDPSVVQGFASQPAYNSRICRSEKLDDIRSAILDEFLHNFGMNNRHVAQIFE